MEDTEKQKLKQADSHVNHPLKARRQCPEQIAACRGGGRKQSGWGSGGEAFHPETIPPEGGSVPSTQQAPKVLQCSVLNTGGDKYIEIYLRKKTGAGISEEA